MDWTTLTGKGTELSILKMSLRGLVVFLAAVMILRIAGKKTFGKQSAADNVIMIMTGAILSRAVVGSSPFLPTLGTSFIIVMAHRFLSWLSKNHKGMSQLIKGNKICLYRNGKEEEKNMKRTLVSREDIFEGIRLQTNSDATEDIREVYIERNGKISVVKK